MLKNLSVWEQGPGGAAENMACDESLLELALSLGTPALRHYSWINTAATFGYFQKYAAVAAMTPLRPLIRRPTGGGLVPHEADWTYSLVFPPDHPWYRLPAKESYHLVHCWVQEALHQVGLVAELAKSTTQTAPGHCFTEPVQFDVLWQQNKIAGAAQRRNRFGLLIQGSIQPPENLDRSMWNQALLDVARHRWNTQLIPWNPPESLQTRCRELVERKYSRKEYNQRR
jgi:lipoate-protein ligase A